MSKNVAVFVDVANIFYAAKAAGVDIDYVTLLKAASAGRDLVRAYAYTGLDPENENQRQFHAFLARNGYKVVSKDIRKYGDGKVKANLDIELVVDMMKTSRNLDIAVVVSGDGDFAPAIRAVQEMGVRVEVISFRGNTSSDLIEVADVFTDITQIARVERSSRSGRRVAAEEEDLSMTEVPDKETEGASRRRRGRHGEGRDDFRREERRGDRRERVYAAPQPVAGRRPARGRRRAARGTAGREAEQGGRGRLRRRRARGRSHGRSGHRGSGAPGGRRRGGSRGAGPGGRSPPPPPSWWSWPGARSGPGSRRRRSRGRGRRVGARGGARDRGSAGPSALHLRVRLGQPAGDAHRAGGRSLRPRRGGAGGARDPRVPPFGAPPARCSPRRPGAHGRPRRTRDVAVPTSRPWSASGTAADAPAPARGPRGPERGPRPQFDRPDRNRPPREPQVEERQSSGSEPWSEVPPEVAELLRAEMARRGGARPETAGTRERSAPVARRRRPPAMARLRRPAPGRERHRPPPVRLAARRGRGGRGRAHVAAAPSVEAARG